jgi:hypothetical protein
MGQQQLTGSRTPAARTPRFPPRECHRKGCERSFLPRQWNQRYCREAECLRLLHRWQAAKRQQRRRSWPENRRQHAQAERQRRIRRREEANAGQAERSARISGVTTAGDAPASRAWSRSERIVGDFCDRPSCFSPRCPFSRAPAHYCGDLCRQAVQRVRDRERKWKQRKKKAVARRQSYDGGRVWQGARQRGRHERTGQATNMTSGRPTAVRNYRDTPAAALSSRETHQEVPKHDRETSVGRRPRPPPSA